MSYKDNEVISDVSSLLADLKNSDWNVRQKAAEELGEGRYRQAIEPLVIALIDERFYVREAAELALQNIDSNWAQTEAAKAALPSLEIGLKKDNSTIYRIAKATIEKIDPTGPILERTRDDVPVHKIKPPSSPIYICPECNVVISDPVYTTDKNNASSQTLTNPRPSGTFFSDKKNGPKCSQGHLLGEVMPFGRSLAIGICAGIGTWILTLVLTSIFPQLYAYSGLYRIAALGWGGILIVRGGAFYFKPDPTRRLALGTFGMGMGVLLGFGIALAWLMATDS